MCNLIDVDNPTYLPSTPADCVLVNKNDMKYELPQTCKDCENCDIDTGQCIVTECPRLLTVKDGSVLGNMNSIGNRVKYTCNPGFKRETEEAIATCQADGTWSITPRCVDMCFHSPCQNGGTCISTTGSERYTCTCKQGFTGQNCDISVQIVCEHSKMTLSCSAGRTIDIKSANYGRTDGTVCPSDTMFPTDCILESSVEKVRSVCSDKNQCQLEATNSFFDKDPCSGTNKYLEVAYICT